MGVNSKADADRQAASLAFIDWITSDDANAPIVKFNNGTVPRNKAVDAFSGPVVDKLVGFSDNLVTYFDWNWPPEITRVFQEGIQAGGGWLKHCRRGRRRCAGTVEKAGRRLILIFMLQYQLGANADVAPWRPRPWAIARARRALDGMTARGA